MAIIVPGILTNDEEDYVARLGRADSVASLVQVDIVDGKFAASITIPVDVVKKYPSSSSLEVQLMVSEPSSHIEKLLDVPYVQKIIFPFESGEDIAQNIKRVKTAGKMIGLSINPETDVVEISAYARELDVLCIFSASPGFSGQQLQNSVYDRINQSKRLFPLLPVEVDIGVNMQTAPKLVRAGADFLVATSALHNAPDYQIAYDELAQVVKTADN